MPTPASLEPASANPQRQRVAAYAVLLRGHGAEQEMLLTRMSARTGSVGRWTLPGGGLDHGEDPRDAVRREVLEETGLHAEATRILDVHSIHFTGARTGEEGGLVEDYHGIHLIFAADLAARSRDVDPHVVEQDGSTDLAAWVPLVEAEGLPLLSAVRHVLDRPALWGTT